MSATSSRCPSRPRGGAAALVVAALVGAALVAAGCAEDELIGPGFDPNPAPCDEDPTLATHVLGDATRGASAVAASCRYVVWLAPVGDAPTGGSPQVHVHEMATGATYRTTDPGSDLTGLGGLVARWSPALHGFWLAYAESTGVVVENLDRLERVRLTPPPRPGGRVAIHYPHVAWEVASMAAGTTIAVTDMTTGQTRVVTPDDETAVGPGLDAGRLVYTRYADDTTGAGDGLQGPARVELLDLNDPGASPVVVAPDAGSHRGGAIGGGVVYYVVRVDNVPRVVAVDAATLAPITFVRGAEVRSFNLDPVVGDGVVAWTNGGTSPAVVVWWVESGQTVTLPASTTATQIAIGERVLVLTPAGDGEHALTLLTLGDLGG